MRYEVKTIAVFERQFKRLAKKYPSLKTDLESLVSALEKEPLTGKPLGKNCFECYGKPNGKQGVDGCAVGGTFAVPLPHRKV